MRCVAGCDYSLWFSSLRSENGRQAGGGAAGVQVTQGPRHPAGPSDRQTGGAGGQGGAVKGAQPLNVL